jgi:hypothetical protein
MNIFRIEVEEEEGSEERDGVTMDVLYETVYIHLRDGTVVQIEDESFEQICEVLKTT